LFFLWVWFFFLFCTSPFSCGGCVCWGFFVCLCGGVLFGLFGVCLVWFGGHYPFFFFFLHYNLRFLLLQLTFSLLPFASGSLSLDSVAWPTPLQVALKKGALVFAFQADVFSSHSICHNNLFIKRKADLPYTPPFSQPLKPLSPRLSLNLIEHAIDSRFSLALDLLIFRLP